MPDKKICPVCGEVFSLPVNRKKQIYCSRDCAVIGRTRIKDSKAEDRVNAFIDELEVIEILDVLEGELRSIGSTDNYLNVMGVRAWQGKKFKVIVYD